MILYHGSPKKLKVIFPQKAKGVEKFENKKAIFLCKTFNHAALYAISKSLKGKLIFAVTPKNIILIGKKRLKKGYVHEVNVRAKKEKRGQYSYTKPIKEFRVHQVFPKDYKDKIIYLKSTGELKKYLK